MIYDKDFAHFNLTPNGKFNYGGTASNDIGHIPDIAKLLNVILEVYCRNRKCRIILHYDPTFPRIVFQIIDDEFD